MKKLFRPNLHVALIHYPVVNKAGNTVASAVTNLDLHDIARLVKTFGLSAFYVVTPLKDQKNLVGKIISHWTRGAGATYNPKRGEALELICIKDSLQEVVTHIHKNGNYFPKTIVTSANRTAESIRFSVFREMLKEGKPYLLLLGTAWGLSESLIAEADYVLEPIKGISDYNHLSVRSAAAIIIDRLIGEQQL